MISFERAYDISVALGGESIDYPGDVPFSRRITRVVEGSGVCEVSSLNMSAHAGAHIDTPSHFIEGSWSVKGREAFRIFKGAPLPP